MNEYLKANLVASLKQSPLKVPWFSWSLVPIFAVLAMFIGVNTGLFELSFIDSNLTFILPVTLFIFPSLLEEAFFRGILIPRNTRDNGPRFVVGFIFISTLFFVLWHPVNALVVNRSAVPLFLAPRFLLIVAALGITCSFAYIFSKSLWVPVLIHWATVLVWVLFLGGRNLILKI